jgi:formylglycine-generating enzyme required for sulfatase activity
MGQATSSSVLPLGAAPPIFARGFGRPPDFVLPPMMTLVPGEFMMGENPEDKYANDTERPRHRVRLLMPFALGRFPVTVAEYRQFRPAHAPEEPGAWPVVQVSWTDANDYCQWLSARSGRHLRLPGEAEWEFACRAGSRTPFATGDEITLASANFLYNEAGQRIGPATRTPVGSYPPNPFGLQDLHGNVCEWVTDSWHENYHGAPADERAWTTPGETRQVIRGGAWDYLPRLLRSSWRDWRPKDYRADNLGFRVATSEVISGTEAAG